MWENECPFGTTSKWMCLVMRESVLPLAETFQANKPSQCTDNPGGTSFIRLCFLGIWCGAGNANFFVPDMTRTTACWIAEFYFLNWRTPSSFRWWFNSVLVSECKQWFADLGFCPWEARWCHRCLALHSWIFLPLRQLLALKDKNDHITLKSPVFQLWLFLLSSNTAA